MKWFSLAIVAVVMIFAADAQARDFWRTPAPITSQVYHANGVELAGDTPHRWYHQPAGYALHVNHGYYTGNAWYHNHDFYHGAFYYGRQGCRNFHGLWSGFCHEKCTRSHRGGCNRCGKSRHRGCGCARGHQRHGCGHHRGCGCGHHPHHGQWDESVPQVPEAAPQDDAPDPPTPKPDVSAGLFENWPRPLAFLTNQFTASPER